MRMWQETSCVCGDGAADTLFEVATAGAPRGRTRIVRCRRCGLRRLDPRPDEEAVKAYYGPSYYSYVGRRRSPVKQAVWDVLRDVAAGVRLGGTVCPQPLLRRIARRRFDVSVPAGSPGVRRVVDVGCGYGDLLLYLRSRGCSVVGIESDPAAAEAARSYDLDIHVGDLQDLALPSGSVDAAVLQHSLEHVADPEALVAELARILRPGGSLHIALPSGDAAGLRGEREAWGSLSNPEHFWYFDRKNLISLLERHELVPEEVAYRTLWRDHWRLFRAEWGSAGARPALRRMARFVAALRASGSGDILRVVARRH